LELDQLTPAVLPPLFHNQRWTVYGRLKTLQPTQVRLQATLDGNQHVWELPITPEQVDPSPVVALLFARRAIRDLEEEPRRGSRQQDRQQQARTAALVSLACRYQLMSSVTSFVAIEERQEGDSTTEIKLRRVPVALTREWGNLEAAIDEDEDEEVIVVGRLEDIDLDLVDLDNADDNIEESLCFCLRDIALDCVELPPPPAIALPAHRRDAILRTLSQQEDDADDLPEDSRGTSEQFTQLVLKQQFDGSWFLDNDLLELTGYTVNQVEKMLHALGSQSNTIRTLIATLLALHTLRRYFSDRQVEWQLLADKAEAWIRQTGLMPPLTNPGDCGVAETPSRPSQPADSLEELFGDCGVAETPPRPSQPADSLEELFGDCGVAETPSGPSQPADSLEELFGDCGVAETPPRPSQPADSLNEWYRWIGYFR
ncbi:MAG: hypothetical protein Q6K08_07235, partial [Thermostichales cyanobacterium GMQP_bins_62]